MPPHLQEYIQAFDILSTRRSIGFGGPNPIPLSDMLAYIKLFKVADHERFISYMIYMDSELLRVLAQRAKLRANNG